MHPVKCLQKQRDAICPELFSSHKSSLLSLGLTRKHWVCGASQFFSDSDLILPEARALIAIHLQKGSINNHAHIHQQAPNCLHAILNDGWAWGIKPTPLEKK